MSWSFGLNLLITSGDEPPVEPPAGPPVDEAETAAGGGGGFGPVPNPELAARKKRKREAEDVAANLAQLTRSKQAEEDFRTLWEAVKIRSDPARRAAAEKKRIAMLLDLEKASLVRQ